MRTIITTGVAYTDIDGLACAMAYKDLLKARGSDGEVIFCSPFTETISNTIRSWDMDYKISSDMIDGSDLNFITVDCANTKILPKFVDIYKTSEVYDHHYLDEKELWKGTDAKIIIELVGACATLIWEKIKQEKLESKISKTSLRLLYAAIVSNTLDLKSSVTTPRDEKAFDELKQLVDLNKDWIGSYYAEVETSMLKDPEMAIKNDTKIVDLSNLKLKVAIGQIELWDSQKFMEKNVEIIIKSLSSFGIKDWFLTSPSISEGKNYIYTQSKEIIKLFENNFGAKFNGNRGETSKLWLRKEILRKLQSL